MPWAVAAAAISAGAGLYESSQAAGAQKKAGNQAIAAQNAQQQKADTTLSPYMESGTQNLNALNNVLGIGKGPNGGQGPINMDFLRGMPGYQFELDQGEEAIMNKASQMGGVNSGNTLKALQQYGTGLADKNLMNFIQLMQQGAQSGQQAAEADVGVGQNTANNTSNIRLQQGNSASAGGVATGQTIGNFFNNTDVQGAFRGMFNQQPTAADAWAAGNVVI